MFESFVESFAGFMWDPFALVLLVGGGLFFLIYSGVAPLRHFRHAIDVLRGKFDNPNDPGAINHFQALSSALAQTVGMGNISGVAIAIMTGGPGALFWMWVSAFLGAATKFFTCTLAVMYRKTKADGSVVGGPMYVITEGLGRRWRPLAYLFAIATLVATLPLFEANQMVQAIRELVLEPHGMVEPGSVWASVVLGVGVAAVVALVIFGGLKRIASVSSRLVPFMVVAYSVSIIIILMVNYQAIPASFALIFRDAFTGDALLGGAVGSVIVIGARRAAFSNEAGIGTAPMFHGDAKTNEPVQEGLVAMLGPIIDTIVVCTMTALAIIVTGVWTHSEASGVTVTAEAFEMAFPGYGRYLLVGAVAIFAMTTLFTFSYYGRKSWVFLFGERTAFLYSYIYIVAIIFGAVFSIDLIINLIDGFYATMAIPTMLSAFLLAPKVRRVMVDYFGRLKRGEIKEYK